MARFGLGYEWQVQFVQPPPVPQPVGFLQPPSSPHPPRSTPFALGSS